MDIVKIGRRIEVKKEPNCLLVHIKARKDWGALLFLPIWLSGWTVGVIFAIYSMFVNGFVPLIAMWLSLWLLMGLFFLFVWFWQVFGQEILRIENNVVVYRREVFAYGITKTFPQNELKNLRASGFFNFSLFSIQYSFTQWGLTGGTVAFDWQDGTHRFAIQLQEKEAQLLVNELQSYLSPYFCAKVERFNFLVQKEGILTRKNSVNRVKAGDF